MHFFFTTKTQQNHQGTILSEPYDSFVRVCSLNTFGIFSEDIFSEQQAEVSPFKKYSHYLFLSVQHLIYLQFFYSIFHTPVHCQKGHRQAVRGGTAPLHGGLHRRQH